MKRAQGRPKKKEGEKKVGLSMKVWPEMFTDLEDVADVQFSDKTKIAEAIIEIGLPMFIERENIAQKLKEYRPDRWANRLMRGEKKRHSA